MSKPSSKKNTPQKNRNRFRIISGEWRGRVLSFAEIEDIRPTADRVRETLFNWLQNEIVGANCLDIYAGSGALGFEAISRGASSVTAIELSGQACQIIQENLSLLKTKKMHLCKANTLNWLKTQTSQEPYDIVFLDPPFAGELYQASSELLETKGWLKLNAFIYVEANKPLDTLELPKNWRIEKQKKAGQVFFGAYRREG